MRSVTLVDGFFPLQGDLQTALNELQGRLAAYLPSNERVVWLAKCPKVGGESRQVRLTRSRRGVIGIMIRRSYMLNLPIRLQ